MCVRVYVRERERWSEVNREKLVVADARYELMSPVCYVAMSSVCCANVLSVDGSGIFDISCYSLDILSRPGRLEKREMRAVKITFQLSGRLWCTAQGLAVQTGAARGRVMPATRWRL